MKVEDIEWRGVSDSGEWIMIVVDTTNIPKPPATKHSRRHAAGKMRRWHLKWSWQQRRWARNWDQQRFEHGYPAEFERVDALMRVLW